MERSEYDKYGDDPKVAKRRKEVQDEIIKKAMAKIDFDEIFKPLYKALGISLPEPLPVGFHGRWKDLTFEDHAFLYEVGICYNGSSTI